MDKKLKNEMEAVLQRVSSSGKHKGVFLSTTANRNNEAVMTSPVRENESVCAGSIIFRDSSAVKDVVKFFDGQVDVFFVDTEVKNEADALEEEVRKAARRTQIVTYKPNDLTVAALEIFLSWKPGDLRGKKALVVGAGNIGAKASLLLAEKSAHVMLVGRNLAKTKTIVDGLNAFKRGHGSIVAKSSLSEAVAKVDILLGCTPGLPAIGPALVAKIPEEALVIDLGSGLFEPAAVLALGENGRLVYSLSTEHAIKGYLYAWSSAQGAYSRLGRHAQGGVSLITPGIFGFYGDILVNDLQNPQKIYGVCDGLGGTLGPEKAAPFLERMKNYGGK